MIAQAAGMRYHSIAALSTDSWVIDWSIKSGVWVFSELRTTNWWTSKTRTVHELSRSLAVTSVIMWHMVCRIPMNLRCR